MRYLLLLFLIITFFSCATVINGTKSTQVTFIPNVKPNRVVLKNQNSNQEQEIFISDTVLVDLASKYRFFKRGKYEISFVKSGFPPINISIVPKISFWYWLNIPLGGIWMFTIDPATGAMYRFDKTSYLIKF